MVYASLIVPEGVPRDFLNMAFEENLVDIVDPSEPHALFDRTRSCACNTRDKLAVSGKTIVVKKNHHEASGFPFYALPENCTFLETYVIVTWLLRNKLKTLVTRIVDGSLQRTLESNCSFNVESEANACCDRYTLKKKLFGKTKFMNRQEYVHALRYAAESTKVYLMGEYKKNFPHYFGNAILETRPATNEDYFVPPSIADRCVVVVGTRFDKTGCNRIGCFPFKNEWRVCEELDPMQWIRIGDVYELACQPSCRDHSIDTEWTRDGRCVLSNPLKKCLASMPEKLFERASRHVFHGGFDIVDGRLEINKRYCDAYGLDFVNGDCVASGGQKFGEWLFGTTTIRAAKVGNLKPLPFKPPPIPQYMQYRNARKRNKRSLSVDETPTNPEIFHNLAVELTKELGREITEYTVEYFLKHKAPKLLSKAVNKLSVRLVLKNSVVVGIKQLGTQTLKFLGTAVGVVTAVYALYELINGILDAVDPYDFQKVISKEHLESIDKELDYSYYRDGVVRPEFTPEYVWDNGILESDDEERLEFMASKVEEYLLALQSIPPNEFHKKITSSKAKRTTGFVWSEKENWDNTMYKCLLFMIIGITVMFLEWIHVWVCCLFFAMLFYKMY